MVEITFSGKVNGVIDEPTRKELYFWQEHRYRTPAKCDDALIFAAAGLNDAQKAGSEKPFVSENDWMKKLSAENQKRILKYADETYYESLKGSLNDGKSYEARRWIYYDDKSYIQAGDLQKPSSGEYVLKFSIAYEKTPDPNWQRLGLMHGHWDKNLLVNLSCCEDGTDIPYFRDVIVPKYDLGNGVILAVSERYLTGWSPKYGYSYLHR